MIAHNSLDPTQLAFDVVSIAGSLVMIFVPFCSKRVRRRWAKLLILAVGIIGTADFCLRLAWHAQWILFPPRASYFINHASDFVGGCLVGWLSAVMLSGEMTGKAIQNDGGLTELKKL